MSVHEFPVDAEWRFHSIQLLADRQAGQLPIGFGGASTGRLNIDGVVLVDGRH